MTLVKLAWWAGGVWAGCGGLFIVLYIFAEFTSQLERGWRTALLVVARRLTFVAPFTLLLWPLLLGVAFYAIRETLREQALELVCAGPLPPRRKAALTESEWQTGTNAVELLAGLRNVSDRKLRLFAVACCRSIWPHLADPRSRHAIDMAERFADGLVGAEDLRKAAAEAADAASLLIASGELEAGAAAKACHDTSMDIVLALGVAERAACANYRARRAERCRQCGPLRDIMGNPFRPLAVRDFPVEVRALALACAGGDEGLYPLLADALEEMGEAEAAAHCRQGPHFKGCHVLDWVIGRAGAAGGANGAG